MAQVQTPPPAPTVAAPVPETREFVTARTRITAAPGAKKATGFEVELTDFSGKFEFEVAPNPLIPGAPFRVRIFLKNDAKNDAKLDSLAVRITRNGDVANPQVRISEDDVKVGQRPMVAEIPGTWVAGTTRLGDGYRSDVEKRRAVPLQPHHEAALRGPSHVGELPFGQTRTSMSLTTRLRNAFIGGLVVLVPIVITVKALWWLFSYLDGLAHPFANLLLGRDIQGLGFVITLATILLAGLLFSAGPLKRLLDGAGAILDAVPVVGSVYGTTKKVLSGFGGPESKDAFQRFVLARLPGRTTPGFVTGSFKLTLRDGVTHDVLTVYVPTNHLYVGDVVILPGRTWWKRTFRSKMASASCYRRAPRSRSASRSAEASLRTGPGRSQ